MTARVGRIRRVLPGEEARLVDVLSDAFDADPFFRWMFGPDETRFRNGLQSWLNLVVRVALPRGEGWFAEPEAGAAIWLPPGTALVGPDELAAVARLLDDLVGDRASEVIGAIGSGSGVVPDVPHWLCLYLGVRPRAQGSGLGKELMQPGLEPADATGVPAHLVSTNPATTAFYERLGFRVLAEVAAPGIPVLRPMWRDAAPRH